MRDGFNQGQFDRFIGQQAQGPAVVARRGRGAGQRRHGGALRAVHPPRAAATRGLGQGGLPAGCFVAAAQLADSLPAQTNSLAGRLLADARGQRH